jgi:hypothetical protein
MNRRLAVGGSAGVPASGSALMAEIYLTDYPGRRVAPEDPRDRPTAPDGFDDVMTARI